MSYHGFFRSRADFGKELACLGFAYVSDGELGRPNAPCQVHIFQMRERVDIVQHKRAFIPPVRVNMDLSYKR